MTCRKIKFSEVPSGSSGGPQGALRGVSRGLQGVPNGVFRGFPVVLSEFYPGLAPHTYDLVSVYLILCTHNQSPLQAPGLDPGRGHRGPQGSPRGSSRGSPGGFRGSPQGGPLSGVLSGDSLRGSQIAP